MTTVAQWRARGGPAAALKAREQPPAVVPRVVPAPQVLELDTLQRRVGSLERNRQHGTEAVRAAHQALDAVAAQRGDLERALSDAEVAREQGQRALGMAASGSQVAAAARALAAGLAPAVTAAQATAAQAGSAAQQALERLAALGVHVVNVGRVGRSLFVRYSDGHEDEVPLPDDRRLLAMGGGAADNAREIKYRTRSVSANTTVTPDIDLWLVDATAGDVTMTMPVSMTYPGRQVLIKKMNTTAGGDVLVIPAVGSNDTIDSDTDAAITGTCRPCAQLISVPDGWVVAATGLP